MAKFRNNNLLLKTNQRIYLGSSNEVEIKYDGSELLIDSSTIRMTGDVTIDSTLTADSLNVDTITPIDATAGVTVNGNITCDELFTSGDTVHIGSAQISSSGGFLNLSNPVLNSGISITDLNYTANLHFTSTNFRIVNTLDEGGIQIRAFNISSTEVSMIQAEPDASVELFYNGGKTFQTHPQGMSIFSVFSDQVDFIHDGNNFKIVQRAHGDGFALQSEDAGGSARNLLFGDADNYTALFYAGTQKVATTVNGITVSEYIDSDTGFLRTSGRLVVEGDLTVDGTIDGIVGQDDSYLNIVDDGTAFGYVEIVTDGEQVAYFDTQSNSIRIGKESGAGKFVASDTSVVLDINGVEYVNVTSNVQTFGVSNDNRIVLNQSGNSMEFYRNNAKELELQQSGIIVNEGLSIQQSGSVSQLLNLSHGGDFQIKSENLAGDPTLIFEGIPDGSSGMYYAGIKKIETDTTGVIVYDYMTLFNTPIESTHAANKAYVDSKISTGVTINAEWQFDDATGASDPGGGKFRMNNTTQSAVTALYINDEDKQGVDMGYMIGNLETGDAVFIQERETSSRAVLFRCTGNATDNGGWWTVPVAVEDSNDEIEDGAECSFYFAYIGPPQSLSHTTLIDVGAPQDDHTQYAHIDGRRAFTGTVGGIDPVADEDLATKFYVDNNAGTPSMISQDDSFVRVVDDGTASGYIEIVADGEQVAYFDAQSNSIRIGKEFGSGQVVANDLGVEIYHLGNKVFESDSTGVIVTGGIVVDDDITVSGAQDLNISSDTISIGQFAEITSTGVVMSLSSNNLASVDISGAGGAPNVTFTIDGNTQLVVDEFDVELYASGFKRMDMTGDGSVSIYGASGDYVRLGLTTSDYLELKNYHHGGWVEIKGEDNGGNEVMFFRAIPSFGCALFYDDVGVFQTTSGGITIAEGSNTIDLKWDGDDFVFVNLENSSLIEFTQRQAGAPGSIVDTLSLDPDAGVRLHYLGNYVFETDEKGAKVDQVTYNPSPDDLEGSGDAIIQTVDSTSSVATVVTIDSATDNWVDANASDESTVGILAMLLEDGGGSTRILLKGIMRDDSWNWSASNKQLYLDTTDGQITETAPSGSGEFIQVVGYSMSADKIYFNPSPDYAEVT